MIRLVRFQEPAASSRHTMYATMKIAGSPRTTCGTDAAMIAMPNMASSIDRVRVSVPDTFAYSVNDVQTLHIA
jgi:hypothetical protein